MIVWIGLLVLACLISLLAGVLLIRRHRRVVARKRWLRARVACLRTASHPSLWEEHIKGEEKAQAILRAAKGDR